METGHRVKLFLTEYILYCRIGHNVETVGTCIALTEEGTSFIIPEETRPSEANKSSGKCNMNPNQCPSKQVKPVACISKILKFKLLVDTDVPDANAQPWKRIFN
ncbi:hypothetical protein BT93_A2279 [Corymbia citriodora subsp. variegata]|nr:hypothetical protein BT93_A2279 [Corymbia citriodora subsp. variegata]